MPEMQRFDPREAFGVSAMPRPAETFHASLQRHYPEELREEGVSGFVLLSVDVDEQGEVLQAKAVRRQQTPGVRVEAHLVDSSGIRPMPVPDGLPHPALRAAAEKAVRETRFHPAELDGVPVPFWDLRIGVRIDPPAVETA
jgi:outer membrane biosynthesis protein TonB